MHNNVYTYKYKIKVQTRIRKGKKKQQQPTRREEKFYIDVFRIIMAVINLNRNESTI